MWRKSYHLLLLYASIFLIIVGSLMIALDEAGYLAKKRKLELDNLRGMLPETGPLNYWNQTQKLSINRQYNFVKTLGFGITSIGFWTLSLALILTGLRDTELSEKLRLAIIIGAIVVMLLMAYGLYSITFSISAGFGR